MFNELALSGLNESAGIFAGPMDPRIGDITLEGANNIGGLDAMDYALQSIYEFRSNIEMADMAAVCEEYAYLKANGIEMVEESAMDTIKEWFSKVKDGIVTIGKRIAEFFKKVLDKLVEETKGDGLWIKTHQKKIDALPGTVKLAKPISGYDYSKCKLFTEPSTYFNTIGNTIFHIKDMEKTGNHRAVDRSVDIDVSDYEDTKSKTAKYAVARPENDEDAKKYDEATNELKKEFDPKKVFANLIDKLPGVSSTKEVKTVAQFKEALVQSVKDSATVFSKVSNVQSMVTELENGLEQRKKIKKSFEDNKKNLNAALLVVKTLEANTEKGTILFELAKCGVGMVNNSLSALVTANRVITQTFEANRAQNKKLINAAISSDKKNQKLEESAYYWGYGDLV